MMTDTKTLSRRQFVVTSLTAAGEPFTVFHEMGSAAP